MTQFAFISLALAVTLIVYHHVVYPMALHWLAERRRREPTTPASPASDATSPRVTMIVPIHNEAAVMVAKLANLAGLDYPPEKLSIVLALDGCTDDSAAIVRAGLARLKAKFDVEMVEYADNIGKIAVLNTEIARARGEIVALSDASAALDASALKRAAQHFSNRRVGVVCGGYRLETAASEGERAYWAYQTAIKADEATLAAPMGAHGAFYAFRRSLWAPLAADTINDDFILPMRIVDRGWRAIYDAGIDVAELEQTARHQEFSRRVRIGAGNVQQVVRLAHLADPRRPALAFVFVSGKGLRALMPFVLAVAAVSAAVLAWQESAAAVAMLAGLSLTAVGITLLAHRPEVTKLPRIARWFGYLVAGHAASGLGGLRYLSGIGSVGWQAKRTGSTAASDGFVRMPVRIAKRTIDIVLASVVLAVLAVLFIPIAVAIKLESAGPILYRQRRVGRILPDRVETFSLIKFRSMTVDAEAKSGAVWAAKNDNRITNVGRFLRKTRLDELPQCLNVLAGDMSMIGPRPERPVFFSRLEGAVPFYAERTYGIRPGITGLAQVTLPYDSSIEDVRMKCVYDHAYAARLTSFREWLRTDFSILFRTIRVMVSAEGH